MTTSINIFAIFCIALVMISGVTSWEARDKLCLTKGPCPNNDPVCFKFCVDKNFPLGGSCIGNLCCCDRKN
ncbi:unnamed protein product [Lathyrus oleraceus]